MPTAELTKPNYQLAEREANRLLRRAGVFEPPVNPVDIAHMLGVNVRFVQFSGDSKEVSGLYDPEDDSILVNREEPGVRQTFTIAHELGHMVLHKEWAQSGDYKVLWRDPRNARDRWEQEANSFAADLLMPRQLVNDYQNLPIERIAQIFAVSEQVAKYRMQNLYGF